MAFKVLNRIDDEPWINWALEMVSAGIETEHLIILAGLSSPNNYFYLRELTDKVFTELSLDISSPGKVLTNYSLYLVREALANKRGYFAVLQFLKELYYKFDFASSFYCLYYAWDDLNHSTEQCYWPGATRENIHSVTEEFFREWSQSNDYQ